MSVRSVDPVNPAHAIRGLHHHTTITADAGRAIAFYTSRLGLHVVKRTIDTDDWQSSHLFLSTTPRGEPGTLLSMTQWRDPQRGNPGIGGTHHVAFETADRDTLLRWKRRLTDLGHEVSGPYDRTYFTSIYTTDPDGLILEIATIGPGWTVDEPADALGRTVLPPPFRTTAAGRDEAAIRAETWPEPVAGIDEAMRLRGLHHVTAIGTRQEAMETLWSDLLGMRLVKRTINFDDPDSPHLYWGIGDGAPGTLVTFFVWPETGRRTARLGTGQTHHFALAVPDESLGYWIERLTDAGLRTTPVRDRTYYRTTQFHDADGHLLELATVGPGLAVDEPADRLGRELKLPEQLKPHRERIEAGLADGF